MDERVPAPTKTNVEHVMACQESGTKDMGAKIASLVYENGIPFNVAASSRFALMIDESIKTAKQSPLQNKKFLT